MDLVLPFTAHIELFNETNWNFSTTAPIYGDPYGPASYVISRSKALYINAKNILNKKKALGFKAVLHSQGISYFYNASFPDSGWNPGQIPLIEANDYLYWMKNGWQNNTNILTEVIDVVDVHPYFNSASYNAMMQNFAIRLSKLAPNGKYIWITETNSGTLVKSEADQIAVFNQLSWFMDNNWVQKAFWYVVRNGYLNDEGDTYAIYDMNRNLIKPNLATVIKKQASKIPSSQRFSPPEYRQAIN